MKRISMHEVVNQLLNETGDPDDGVDALCIVAVRDTKMLSMLSGQAMNPRSVESVMLAATIIRILDERMPIQKGIALESIKAGVFDAGELDETLIVGDLSNGGDTVSLNPIGNLSFSDMLKVALGGNG